MFFLIFKNDGQELSFSVPEAVPEGVHGLSPNGASSISALDQEVLGDTVSYDDLFGPGIDLEVRLGNEALYKEVVIENLEALGDLSGKENVEFAFKLTSATDFTLKAGGTSLLMREPLISDQGVSIIDAAGRTSYFWPPIAKDAARKSRPIPITIRYEKKADGVYLTKLLPVAWLKTATFPVRTDTTVSYFAGSGDGGVYNNNASWSSVQGASC